MNNPGARAIVRVLDSWAILAFLEDEPAAPKVEMLLNEAVAARIELKMTVVNLGEVWYSICRAESARVADKAIDQILSLGVVPVSITWELARQAALYKARGKISYADCFAAALAQQEGAELVTGDREFEQINDQIGIVWL